VKDVTGPPVKKMKSIMAEGDFAGLICNGNEKEILAAKENVSALVVFLFSLVAVAMRVWKTWKINFLLSI
jgi:hypothetical protein